MTNWHAHVVHLAKRINTLGAYFWWGTLSPGFSKSGAARVYYSNLVNVRTVS